MTSNINRDIENLTFNAAYQFCLSMRIQLIMEAA